MSLIRSHLDRIGLTELPDGRAGCADFHEP